MRRPPAIALLVLALAACASPTVNPSTAPSAPGTAGSSAAPSTLPPIAPSPAATAGWTIEQATTTYGYGASRDANVTYQPDVVIVEGGPSIIRWASANGLVWAIDRNAPGAADLKVDSVMFATSRAVGRVAEIHDEGDSRVVTLAPIDLTELVSDANLQLDQDIDLGSMAYQVIPDPLGAVSEPGPSDATGPTSDGPVDTEFVSMPRIRFAVAHLPLPRAPAGAEPPGAPAAPTLPIAGRTCPEVALGNWSVKTCYSGSLSINVDYRGKGGLKAGVGYTLLTDHLHVTSGTTIRNGKVVASGGLIHGIKGFEVHFLGGAADGANDNKKFKLEIPIEIEEAVPPSPATLGIPLNNLIEFKLIVEMAFSGKNSTLQGDGAYTLAGPVGVVDGKVTAPTLAVRRSLLDDLRGVTLGPSGIVAAIRWKIQSGIGVPGLVVGPYATLTASVGISRGSVLGGPLADCHGVSLSLWAGVGAGLTANFDNGRLEALLGKTWLRKWKWETDVNFLILDAKRTVPNVPLCRG